MLGSMHGSRNFTREHYYYALFFYACEGPLSVIGLLWQSHKCRACWFSGLWPWRMLKYRVESFVRVAATEAHSRKWETMADEKERFKKALDFMKTTLGVSVVVMTPILRDILKIYGSEWSYIEAENYRVLADSYFELQDEQKLLKVIDGEMRAVTRSMATISPKPGTKSFEMIGNGSGSDVISASLSAPLEIAEPKEERLNPIKSEMRKDNSFETEKRKPIATCLRQPKVECLESGETDLGLQSSREGRGTLRPNEESYEATKPDLGLQSAREGRGTQRHDEVSSEATEPDLGLQSSREGRGSLRHNGVSSEATEAYYFNQQHFLELSDGEVETVVPEVCRSQMHKESFSSRRVRSLSVNLDTEETQASTQMGACSRFPLKGNEASGILLPSLATKLEHLQRESVSVRATVEVLSNISKDLFDVKDSTPSKKSCIAEMPQCSPSLEQSIVDTSQREGGRSPENRAMKRAKTMKAKVGALPYQNESLSLVVKKEGNVPCANVTYERSSLSKGSGKSQAPTTGCLELVLFNAQEIQMDSEKRRRVRDTNDISRGLERVPISIAKNSPMEKLPDVFYYIEKSVTYQNAYVNFSLARVDDYSCCAGCDGDCLRSAIPCACARETGGEYAYNSQGQLHESFLQEALEDRREEEEGGVPKRTHFCESGYSCPIERVGRSFKPEPCKGHLIRKFIKECWVKCGCERYCGNRVVQRGINYKLQVFYTPEGKGWGVRTLEFLPRGTFVCEYVGEIITNIELDGRNRSGKGHLSHYPVLLDADWGSENVLKDDEALCLDATYYGNVARFVNHRCHDANLLDIPVEIESPDRHYYHVAFFTTRPVLPNEELTWDYCIDFEDQAHPIQAFKCLCGSRYCRGRKRYNAKTQA